jgi:hypothetical protein
MTDSRLLTSNYLVLVGIIAFFSVAVNGQKPSVRDRDPVKINKKGEITNRAILKNYAKFHYEDGGSFRCVIVLYAMRPGDEDPCKENRIRDFIWEHYIAKKRGYVRVNYVGVDTGAIEHIFIEPDIRGNWKVSWWTESRSWLSGNKIYAKKVFDVQRIENSETENWKLVFSDERGVILERIPGKFSADGN